MLFLDCSSPSLLLLLLLLFFFYYSFIFCNLSSFIEGARCSSVVRAFAHGAMGRRIDPSWSGLIELFLVPASAPRLVYQRPCYVLSCLWDGAYKRTLAVNRKE